MFCLLTCVQFYLQKELLINVYDNCNGVIFKLCHVCCLQIVYRTLTVFMGDAMKLQTSVNAALATVANSAQNGKVGVLCLYNSSASDSEQLHVYIQARYIFAFTNSVALDKDSFMIVDI